MVLISRSLVLAVGTFVGTSYRFPDSASVFSDVDRPYKSPRVMGTGLLDDAMQRVLFLCVCIALLRIFSGEFMTGSV